MKYKLLSSDELKTLEKEFIDYLIINGITADLWENMKKDKPKEANQILELFSDVVFEGIMQKIRFLEFRSSHDLKIFQCLKDKMVLVGLSLPKHLNLDIRDPEQLERLAQNPPSEASVYTSEKTYGQAREEELFKMTEQGCLITDDKMFKVLCLSLS